MSDGVPSSEIGSSSDKKITRRDLLFNKGPKYVTAAVVAATGISTGACAPADEQPAIVLQPEGYIENPTNPELNAIINEIQARYIVRLDFTGLSDTDRASGVEGVNLPPEQQLEFANKIKEFISKYPPGYMQKIGLSEIKGMKSLTNSAGGRAASTLFLEYEQGEDDESGGEDVFHHEIFHLTYNNIGEELRNTINHEFILNNPPGFQYLEDLGITDYRANLATAVNLYSPNRDYFIRRYGVKSQKENQATFAEKSITNRTDNLTDAQRNKANAVWNVYFQNARDLLPNPDQYEQDLRVHKTVNWDYWSK